MQEERIRAAAHASSFGTFLRTRRFQLLIILTLAFALRTGVLVARPEVAADIRYRTTAINILEGHGYSMDTRAPYHPSEATVPVYPLFIATLYAVFGRHESVVKVSQSFIDLFTCLLVAFVSFNLAPASLKNGAGISSLIIYGFFSWPTIVWIPAILTETLAVFFTVLTVALCSLAMRKGLPYWFGAGLTCGLAILTRPDSVLLMSAVVLFLMIRLAHRPSRAGAVDVFVFCLAVALALAPWVVRNYVSLKKFQPLASEYGSPQEGYFPTGYLWWLRTWITDETHFDYVFNPAWFPDTTFFDPDELPRDAYDSEGERRLVVNLIARYNQSGYISPDLDDEFRDLANARVRRSPLRFFLLTPLHRATSLWLTGFSTRHPTPYMLVMRILSVLPIHVGGALGLALWCRRQPLAALLLLVVLTRTVFMSYHYAPETRYIIEVYPPMIAACGVTVAALWLYALTFRRKIHHGRLGEATP
ncbi:MAG TPA: glycosyltransferase family 39 protein [Pyrinomonadaceae bacterium]|jgi:4-amino-4-deoxy-L-arabinose transferase-like glycosyltransferase|nr:glycosyltransferase family 39 protein [Pyrinomonadaceae bacterium]